MLILLPPSESKANRRRGRPADAVDVVVPRPRTHPRSASPRRSSRRAAPPTPPPLLGVSEGTARRGRPQPHARHRSGHPAAEVYTGVLYDALDLASLDTAARRRANRWLVVVSALHGAVRPGDRITAYRLSMGVDAARARAAGPGVAPALDPVLPERRRARGVVVDCRSAAYAAAWRPGADLAVRWVQVRVPGASHMAKHTRGLVARHLCEAGVAARSVPVGRRRGRASPPSCTSPSDPGPWVLDVVGAPAAGIRRAACGFRVG